MFIKKILHYLSNIFSNIIGKNSIIDLSIINLVYILKFIPGLENLRYRIHSNYIKKKNNTILRWININKHNSKLLINLNSLYSQLFFKTGAYEQKTKKFIENNLKPGDIFVDIGSNIGYFSILAASIVGQNGKVFSIEPNPDCIKMLNLSIKKNNYEDIVKTFQFAISDIESENQKFFLSNSFINTGLSTLKPWKGHLDSGALSNDNYINVKTITFDEFYLTQKIKNVRMIKIDVEGLEYEVLNGMKRYLSLLKPDFIICETSKNSDTIKLLESYNYYSKLLENLDTDSSFGNYLFYN